MTKLLPYFPFLFFLRASFVLSAQDLQYDLGDYKARYEQRPGMELNFNSNFAGSYQTNLSGGYNGSFSGNTEWFLHRNTDSLISNFDGTSILDIGRSLPPFHSSLFTGTIRPQSDDYLLPMGISLQQDRYQAPDRLWGYSLALAAADARMASDPNPEMDDRVGVFNLNASLYRGIARIEFAEDALLARWMLQGLQAAGPPAFTPEMTWKPWPVPSPTS